jgi:predicted nuclease of predicted toxin-antitoxin system
VQEDGREGLADPLVLDRAMELNRVVFSQDTDFLIEGARRQTEGIAFAGIIFGRQRKTAIGIYVQDLELIAKSEEPENYVGVVEYLPL